MDSLVRSSELVARTTCVVLHLGSLSSANLRSDQLLFVCCVRFAVVAKQFVDLDVSHNDPM